ncbi:MAG: ATPase domain-containing protein [Candidatus Helarchaeota archaeon]
MVTKKVSTGCKSLDALIDNGLPTKKLIHIYGESGTGKSTLAIQCAKNCVLDGWTVLVLDNERTCSSARLKTMCQTSYSQIAQSILVYEPYSFENQSETIENLENYITQKTKMIIIDTITTQYRRAISEKGEKNIQLNKRLNHQIAILKDLTIKHDLITIITNQVRGSMRGRPTENGIEPVAAPILNYWADFEIQLQFFPDRQMSKRRVIITKHPTQHDRSITEIGLTNVGFQEID